MSRSLIKEKKKGLVYKEVYPLNEPYAYAAIVYDPAAHELMYMVMEPKLTDEEKKLMKHIKEMLFEELSPPAGLKSTKEAEEFLRSAIRDLVKRYKIKVKESSLDKIMYYICRDTLHYGKIDPLMRDHWIEDIGCDGVGIPIYVWHRKYENLRTNVVFTNEDELDDFVVRLAYRTGRYISIAEPMLDAVLPDGSRVQLTYKREVTMKGSTFSIRRFRSDPLTITDLIAFNTLSPRMAAYLWFAIEHKKSIMIAGATASGKTTLMNSIAMFIKPEYKIVTIEDTPELNLPHENWIQSVARSAGMGESVQEISLFDLLKAAMRQRPDYIIVGEVRGEEAYTLFQAIATGHGGMCTIHAEDVAAVIHRLTTKPMNIPLHLVPCMNVITVQVKTRMEGRPVRRTKNITEVLDVDPRTGELRVNPIYNWDPSRDTFVYTGRSYLLELLRKEYGYTHEYIEEELTRREIVLRWMVAERIRHFKEVSRIIGEYYKNPKKIFERAKAVVA